MKKKIRINTDAGNVEAGIAAFNSSIAEDVDYQTERQDLIARLKAKGYKYASYDKFDNRQLYRMLQKNPPLTKAEVATPKQRPTCDECGNYLTDGGYCPVCDDGEEHLKESFSMENDFTIKYEQLPIKRQSGVNTRNGYPDWDEWEDTVDYELELSTNDVDEGLLAQEDIWNEPGIEDDNAEEFVAARRESLFDKYKKELKEYFKDMAINRAQSDADSGRDNFRTYSEYDYFEDEYMDKARGLGEDFYDDDDIESSKYTRVSSKSVEDSDGFMTDYTWYKTSDGNNIFVFGDSEIYTPDTTEWDWEEEDDEAAEEWFNNYEGFGRSEDYLDENVMVDQGVPITSDNVWKLEGRGLKGDAADVIMEYYLDPELYVTNEGNGRFVVSNLHTKTKVVVQFDLDCPHDIHKFTIDGVEYSTPKAMQAGKIISDSVVKKHRKSFDVPVDEAWERDYNLDEWEEEDIELHKSIDWKARNYNDYPVTDDVIEATAVAYGLPGGTQTKKVKFIKHIRANELFPPYYKAETIPFDGVLSGMYDGDKHGKYMIMNRFETQDVYDALSESRTADKSNEIEIKLSKDSKMLEIPIEDNSEVGELGHPIQHGIGDPRRKKRLAEARSGRFELEVWVPGSGGDDDRERFIMASDNLQDIIDKAYEIELDGDEAFYLRDMKDIYPYDLDQCYDAEELEDAIHNQWHYDPNSDMRKQLGKMLLPKNESVEGNNTITLKNDYFYDIVSNIENAGWDEILDFAYEHGWVKEGQIIIPAGTVLEFATQDRYYDTYRVQVGEDSEFIPFNRDLLIEYPLEEDYVEGFKEGDMVYVKPSKKHGRVVSVKGGVVEVEIDGGNDPDRRDSFYTSDLEREVSLIESKDAVEYEDDSKDKTRAFFVRLVEEAYTENPRELMKNKREDGAEFDEKTGRWIKIHYNKEGKPEEERVALKESEDSVRSYVTEFAKDSRESGHPVEDYAEFKAILKDDGITATDRLYQLYLDSFYSSEDEDIDESLTEAMTYIDTNGFLGEPGEKYTMSQFRRIWQDRDGDPVMSEYDSFEEWVGETISQMDAHEEDRIEEALRDDVDSLAQDVQTAIYHLVHDLGKDSSADDFAEDVVLDLEKELNEEEIPTDPMEYREWASSVIQEVSRQLNNPSFLRLIESTDDPKSWSDDKELTYEEALALAKAYYAQGGDGFYETTEKSDFEYMVTEFGPMTVRKMKQDFGVFDSVAKDRMSDM